MDHPGHIIRPGCLEVCSHTIDAVFSLKALYTITELSYLLALWNEFSAVPIESCTNYSILQLQTMGRSTIHLHGVTWRADRHIVYNREKAPLTTGACVSTMEWHLYGGHKRLLPLFYVFTTPEAVWWTWWSHWMLFMIANRRENIRIILLMKKAST